MHKFIFDNRLTLSWESVILLVDFYLCLQGENSSGLGMYTSNLVSNKCTYWHGKTGRKGYFSISTSSVNLYHCFCLCIKFILNVITYMPKGKKGFFKNTGFYREIML